MFFGYLFLKFQKNRSKKLSMLKQKQENIWNLHWIPHKIMKPNFKFSSYYSKSSNRNIFFPKNTDFLKFDLRQNIFA